MAGTASRRASQRGQASVELVAALPMLLLTALVALQLLAAGYTLTLVDGAAEAGALALASGQPAAAAARNALPGWAGRAADIEVRGGRVSVSLRPPSIVPGLGARIAVHGEAFARPAGHGALKWVTGALR